MAEVEGEDDRAKKTWATVKPLELNLGAEMMRKTLLIDDDAYKSLPSERSNLVRSFVRLYLVGSGMRRECSRVALWPQGCVDRVALSMVCLFL